MLSCDISPKWSHVCACVNCQIVEWYLQIINVSHGIIVYSNSFSFVQAICASVFLYGIQVYTKQ